MKRIFCAGMLCFIAACAQPGRDPNGDANENQNNSGDDKEKEKKGEGNDLNLSSAFLTADSTLPIPTLGCRKPIARVQFPKTPDQVKIDGSLSEWTDPQLVFSNGEIASSNFNAGNVYGGINEHLFAFGTALNAPLNAFIFVEFGGARVKDGLLTLERTLTLRTNGRDLQELTEDRNWSSISPSLFTLGAADNALEVAISRRFVGEAVNWPVWWFRIYDEPSALQPFQSSVRFYEKQLQSSLEEVDLSSCEDWGGKSSGQIFFDELDFFPTDSEETRLDRDQKDLSLQAIRASISALSNLPLQLKRMRFQIVMSPYGTDLSKFADHNGKAPFTFFNFNPKRIFSERPLAQQKIFADSLKMGLAALLRFKEPENTPIGVMMTAAVYPNLIKAYIGEKYFFENFFEDFLPEGQSSNSVAYFLSELFPLKDLFSTIETLSKSAALVDLSLLIQTLKTVKPDSLTNVEEIFDGWFNTPNYSPKYTPAMLTDPDGDGLVSFTEIQRGLNPNSQDTDRDGWSDFSEVIYRSDPLNYSVTPGRIVADGNFGDFLGLMPKLVGFDQNFNASCPKSLDITHFAALSFKNLLTVGVATGGSNVSDPNSFWEVSIIDLRSHRQFVLRHFVSRRSYTLEEVGVLKPRVLRVNAPTATSGTGAEWQIDLSWLGLAPLTSVQNQTVELQVRSFIQMPGNAAQACDETNSFMPFIASGIR